MDLIIVEKDVRVPVTASQNVIPVGMAINSATSPPARSMSAAANPGSAAILKNFAVVSRSRDHPVPMTRK
jgi:hypothetical protein